MQFSSFKATAIETWPLDRIKPYPNNPYKHTETEISELASMFLLYGFDQPIVVDGDGVIIKGHRRRLAAMHAGWTSAPVIVRADLAPEVVRAARIADNESGRQTEIDKLLMAREVLDIRDKAPDLVQLLGLDKKSIESLLKPVVFSKQGGTEGNTDPDSVPEKAPTRARPGDLWTLGNHRLLCGDSTDGRHVEKLLGGDTAALCFTSPPYADQRQYNGGKELSTEKLAGFIKAAAAHVTLFAVNLGMSRKDGEVNAYWDDYIAAARSSGLKLLSWNVWSKGVQGSIGQLSAMFPIAHEWIFVFGVERVELNLTVPNKNAGLTRDVTDRQFDGSVAPKSGVTIRDARPLGTVIEMSGEKARNHGSSHPAMFPVALPVAYLEGCSNPGGLIYEPFAGSGTTLIAAERTGRRCAAMEIDPSYCDVILKRWEEFTGLSAVKADHGRGD